MRNSVIVFCLLFAGAAGAQTLAPATSEDLNEFDRQLQETQVKPEQLKKMTGNFGTVVSEESKRLRSAEGGNKQMGVWVREQRRQNGANGGQDAKASAPVNNDRGNSGNPPGRSGNKKN